ncbi:MAG: hypothetical protein WAV89_09235 [Ignavibacteriaceae bacterium]
MFANFKKYLSDLKKKNIRTSEELSRKLLEETGVAVLPDGVFGRPKKELTIRIAYVDFDGAKALAAAETLPAYKTPDEVFLNANCSNILDGIDLICRWVREL